MGFIEERRFHAVREEHLNLEWNNKEITGGTIKAQGFVNKIITSEEGADLITCLAGEHGGQICIYMDKIEAWEVVNNQREKLLALTTETVPIGIHYPQSMYELREATKEFIDDSLKINQKRTENVYKNI